MFIQILSFSFVLDDSVGVFLVAFFEGDSGGKTFIGYRIFMSCNLF